MKMEKKKQAIQLCLDSNSRAVLNIACTPVNSMLVHLDVTPHILVSSRLCSTYDGMNCILNLHEHPKSWYDTHTIYTKEGHAYHSFEITISEVIIHLATEAKQSCSFLFLSVF